MLWLRKIGYALRAFMAGRNGVDSLSMALLWTGLIVNLLGGAVGWTLLSYAGSAAGFWALFRALSKNRVRREAENRRFVLWRLAAEKNWKQARVRRANRKQFKYFKCLGCKAWLKIPRGAGVVTVTCGRCKNSFTQKA